jgi:S-DNA-T family DNA segregation ATPase FtsK/SpoIIIE
MPRPGSSHFADHPKPAEQPAAPAEPVKPAANLDADLLKPAKPRGLFTGQKAAATPPVIPPAPGKPAEQPATAAKEETEPAAAPSADRLSRLEQLRAGQTRPAPAASTPAPASPFSRPSAEPEPVKPAPVTPAPASPAASSSPFGPKPTAPAANLPTTPPGAPPVVPSKPGVTAHTTRQKKSWTLADYKTLLASGSEQDFDRETLVKRARVIEETLQSFGAPGRVVEINTGPVITQFGVEPDYLMARGGKKSRVKVSAIAQLDKDLQLSLNAKSIRIEAPVPGKGFVGIEVPNDEAATVNLRDVMESREFKRIKSPLAIALGQSVDGAPVAADLAAMPHLLIAGTTGSGKSVCVNAVIISLILQNSPDVVKFIMVDPKRVELTGYNGIPHLVAPVVVELERVVGVLKWVTREMDERYKRFSNAGARNIVDYNNHLPEGSELMPYIVVIIDELADLMMLAPDETERTITRIAALARATGIHLVIATQRPSVDVVTGLIKANFPARIAFAVASGIDSRVILDQPGAEKLLGRGDMLYMSGDSPAPLRLQGVYVSDAEINNVNRFWRAQQLDAPKAPVMSMAMDDSPVPMKPQAASSAAASGRPNGKAQQAFWDDDEVDEDDGPATGQDDEMYEEAVELVRRLNKASVSLLQRRLRIGYTRAARLIDVMEERGIVGPPTEGSKPRMVLPVRPE